MTKRSGKSSPSIERREFVKLGAAGLGVLVLSDLNTSPALAQQGGVAPTQRSAAASAQRGGVASGSIDVHAHWVPDAYAKAFAELGKGRPLTSLHVPMEQDSNLEQRLKWMDEHGIKMHVLTLDGGMPWQWASAADAVHLAQIVNDAALAAHAKYPDRFVAGIELPIRQPDLALAELNRMAGKPGMRAVHLPNSMENTDFLFQGAYDPIWARCEALGYPVLFHPLDSVENIYGGKSRLGNELELSANLNNTLGYPIETATTAAKFILTGTLDRFPGLQIVLPHSGGCFPYVAGRVERGLAAKKFPLKRPFREYVRRFHYDSITYYPETLQFLVNMVGSDRVVIGSDFYAPMEVEEPNALTQGLNLAAQDRDRILFGNAARLLRV